MTYDKLMALAALAGEDEPSEAALTFMVEVPLSDDAAPIRFGSLAQARTMANFLARRGDDVVLSVAQHVDGILVSGTTEEIGRVEGRARSH